MPDPGKFFALLVDPADATPETVRLELAPGTGPDTAAVVLTTVFEADPDLDRVAVTMGGQSLGVSRRERFVRTTSREFGSADHSALPGPSRRFTLLRFACRDCGRAVLRVHADWQLPSCPDHGLMELTR